MNVTETDLAYAAGIIDGEGYIGIIVAERDKRRETISPQFTAVVNVGMADAPVVEWLAATFGGKVYSYAPRAGTRGRGVHHWRRTSAHAAEFCHLIHPYLRLKRRQAELVIAFRADPLLVHTRRGGPGVRTPPAEIDLKRRYAAEIRSLNQREVPA